MPPIYIELRHCKPENIFFKRLVASPAYRLEDRFLLAVNRPENEQILDILHELVHGYPEFRSFDFGKDNRTELVEDAIQEQAEEIFENRPTIREYVRKQLQLAKRKQKPWYEMSRN